MFITSSLTAAARRTAAAAAVAANARVADECHRLRAIHGAVKRDNRPADPFGPLDSDGSEQRRRRWTMAYEATCLAYGLPFGSVYVPCYLCPAGTVFDAWSLDAEHIDAGGGTYTGNLLLACHPHNHGKSGSGQIHPAHRQYVLDVVAGHTLPRGSVTGRAFFGARARRKDGSDMAPRV